jgi:hypothetical protein
LDALICSRVTCSSLRFQIMKFISLA